MFFIVNHENSIIAADTDFLEEVGTENIYEVALLIKKGEIVLDELEQSISYFQNNSTFYKTKLSTFLGDAYLYEINEAKDQTAEEPQKTENSQKEAPFNLAILQSGLHDKKVSSLEEEFLTADTNTEEEIKDEEIFSLTDTRKDDSLENASLSLSAEFESKEDIEDIDSLLSTSTSDMPELRFSDDKELQPSEEDIPVSQKDIIGLLETDIDANTTEDDQPIDFRTNDESFMSLMEKEEEENTEDEVVSFLSDDASSVTPAEAEIPDREKTVQHDDALSSEAEKPIPSSATDFLEIAKLIGVSEEEYSHFLDDFEKESILLEPSLRSNDLKESREALSILKEISLLLHLPKITEKLNGLSNATSDEKSSIVDGFLAMVTQARSMAGKTVSDNDMPATHLSDHTEEKVTFLQESLSEEEQEPVLTKSIKNLTEKVSASLDKVEPIPFDFSLNEAADELTLPASLVSEFVIDFINQAKENLPVLQKAYEERDMDTIETTAHMLKGASSNLRIAPIAETLYQLQFNQDFAQVPELITLFTGQLKALSIQMDQI